MLPPASRPPAPPLQPEAKQQWQEQPQSAPDGGVGEPLLPSLVPDVSESATASALGAGLGSSSSTGLGSNLARCSLGMSGSFGPTDLSASFQLLYHRLFEGAPSCPECTLSPRVPILFAYLCERYTCKLTLAPVS